MAYTEPVEAKPTDQLASLGELTKDLREGKVDVLIILGSNPVFTAPRSSPGAPWSGVGNGMNGTRLPSGRSAIASTPRTGRPSLSAIAIGH